MKAQRAEGIILLYHYAPPYAATVLEHVRAFAKHSEFAVWPVNVEDGYPPALDRLDPAVVVLHYSLFGSARYFIGSRFLEFLDRLPSAYRIAFFQDEHYYCLQRFGFIDRHRIDCIYTLVESQYQNAVYGTHTHGPETIGTIPGYVSDDLPNIARRFGRPESGRRIDVGYRSRRLPYYMGRGAQEKHEIGNGFKDLAAGSGLRIDIETDESSRLYGDKWYEFLGNCRAVLGVEAGVSIFDLDDSVRRDSEHLLRQSPNLTFEEMTCQLLGRYEGNIPYRTISPRHFEAAAFRVTQILYEGRYSGILQPMIHYLPLRKDFSNLDEIIRLFKDPEVRGRITNRAYDDLIASGKWSYAAFIEGFDAHLAASGVVAKIPRESAERIRRLIDRGSSLRGLRSATRRRYRRWADGGTGSRVREVVRHVITSGS